ncbi:MAG: hypothetical protein ACTS5Y_12925 [Pollutimonas bauzanensis]|nr:hypothetical protein [Pollutimonas bauzanensis]
MSDIGQVVIASSKIEADYIRANNGGETPFLDRPGMASYRRVSPELPGIGWPVG